MPERFATIFILLYLGHHLGDYWIQSERQTAIKALPGARGRLACVEHVTTYTLTLLVVLIAGCRRLGLDVDIMPTAVSMLISMVTHYFADRREPLRRLALALRHGSTWIDSGGGLALLDQSWHLCWLGVAAIIVT